MSAPRPLAIGLLHHQPTQNEGERRKTRASLLSRANAEGFAVAEVFETDGRPLKDADTMTALESLATRVGARTVLTIGAIDRTFLTVIARRSQLMVLTMPDRSPRRSRLT